MIEDCGLIDAGYEGSNFTWTNNRIWKRLDRILYSEVWLNLFHMTKVSHLPRIWSDHAPLLISLSMNLAKSPPSFRSLRMWTRHHSFWETVKTLWQQPTDTEGMKNLQQKLYRLKQLLRWWNKNVFGDIFENIKKLNKNDTNLIELKRCTVVLTQVLTVEKDYWRQKVACRWVDEGERNTKFFHSLVKKKRSKSRVHSITHEGIHLTDLEEIKQSTAKYF
ncbi:hypothetical protein Pfo_029577 [Paulownia fortunei]|nr:hypothetical protein Pfo_029577 [Paulownia fortunei]